MPKAKKRDLTWLLLIVDRSGSMNSMKDDAEGGINAFLKEQAGQKGECVLTLAQFDTEYEVVHDSAPLTKTLEKYVLHPRGGTALLDAVGKTLATTYEKYEKLDKKDRPGLVYVLIVTDGQENSSREYRTAESVRTIIEARKKDGWQFQFLGADASAFEDGHAMGISNAAKYSGQTVSMAYATTSHSMTRARAAAAAGASVGDLTRAAAFTDEEVDKMGGTRP